MFAPNEVAKDIFLMSDDNIKNVKLFYCSIVEMMKKQFNNTAIYIHDFKLKYEI